MIRRNRVLGKRGRSGAPMGRNKRSRSSKRSGRRRRRYAGRPYIKVMRQPVPDQMLTKLNYSENLVIPLLGAVGGALSPSLYRFQTSLYDPDYTGTGHQPMWRDTLATMYNKYRVHGIKYRFTIKNISDSSNIITGAIRHTSLTTTDGDYRVIRERRGTQKFHTGSFLSMPTVVKGYMSTNRPYGITKREFMSDEDFDADIGSNPTKMAYLDLYAWTMSSTNVNLNVIVDLTFYASFDKRQQPSAS